MKRRPVFIIIVGLIGIFLISTQLRSADKIPQEIINLAKTDFFALGKDPIIVNAVKAENAKGKTLDQIKEMDKKWQETPGLADFMKALMESQCGKYIISYQTKHPYIDEIFVMDNQGANVAMTNKTSDYWQGDEDKFVKSFNNGKGDIHFGDVKFDQSTQAYLVQVSVPVKDGNRVIGAITFGVDIEKIK